VRPKGGTTAYEELFLSNCEKPQPLAGSSPATSRTHEAGSKPYLNLLLGPLALPRNQETTPAVYPGQCGRRGRVYNYFAGCSPIGSPGPISSCLGVIYTRVTHKRRSSIILYKDDVVQHQKLRGIIEENARCETRRKQPSVSGGSDHC